MKTKHFLCRSAFVVSSLLAATMFVGCAEGYDSPNGFDSGVTNQTLVTPDSLSFAVSADGTTATISWPLVIGADGYLVTMKNIDDPDNPVVVDGYENKMVDGCQMTASIAEDSKYSFSFQAIGDTKRNKREFDE